ncbi:MAG: tetratricopeptide repeat protein [Deltaproteobacteria bacterium]|nr:tetratricopeptide repeat protein [Deltaproteobacteria bacterium]
MARPRVPSLGLGPGPDQARRQEDLNYYLEQGDEHLQHRRLEDARIALERAYQISPESPRTQNLLGLVYFKLGLLEAARALYDRLVIDHPVEAPLWVNLGLVLLRQGRLREAERALRRAIQLQPGHTRAHAYLGLVLYRRGDLELARDHFVRGRAKDLARRVEAKLSGLAETPASHLQLLQEVGDEAQVALDQRLTPFRPLEAEGGAGTVRDEEAWEAVVTHSQPPAAERTEGSLIPAWALSGDLPSLSVLEPAPISTRPAPSPTADLSRRPNFDSPTPELLSIPLGFTGLGAEATVRTSVAVVPDPYPKLLWAPPRNEQYSEPPPRGSAPLGFEAGPGNRARLGIESHAYLRSSALATASGALNVRDARGGSGLPLGGKSDPLCLLEGQASILIRVRQLAVALVEVTDLHVVESVLAGFDRGFEWERSRVLSLDVVSLRGRGSVLLDALGAPLLMPVEPDTPVHAAEDVLLAWSDGVRPGAVDVATEGRLLRLRGHGYVLVAFPPELPGGKLSPEGAE